MKAEHPYSKWAAKSIEVYLRENRRADPVSDTAPQDLLNRSSGCFVSLHKLNGELRGCIGTYMATKSNLALEIRDNAIASATQDPRFPPLALSELENIAVSVDILNEPELTEDISTLDPKIYGVIVISGWKRGLLLPDLPGVESIEDQLSIACMKAGINRDESFQIYRFTVERYH